MKNWSRALTKAALENETTAETRTAVVSIRVRPSLYSSLRKKAGADGQILAQYVERTFEAHLRRLGKL